MPPHSMQSTQPPSQRSVLWPTDIPDAMLVRIFVHVSFDQKHLTLPRVCKGWRELLQSNGTCWRTASLAIMEHNFGAKYEPRKLAWTMSYLRMALVDREVDFAFARRTHTPIMCVFGVRGSFDVSRLASLALRDMNLPPSLRLMTQLRELALHDVTWSRMSHFSRETSTWTVLQRLTNLQNLQLVGCEYDTEVLRLPESITSLFYRIQPADSDFSDSHTTFSALPNLRKLRLVLNLADYNRHQVRFRFDGLMGLTQLRWQVHSQHSFGDGADTTSSIESVRGYAATVRSARVLRNLKNVEIEHPFLERFKCLPAAIWEESSSAFEHAFQHWTALTSLRFSVERFDRRHYDVMFRAPPGLLCRSGLRRLHIESMMIDATALKETKPLLIKTAECSLQSDRGDGGRRKWFEFHRCLFEDDPWSMQPLKRAWRLIIKECKLFSEAATSNATTSSNATSSGTNHSEGSATSKLASDSTNSGMCQSTSSATCNVTSDAEADNTVQDHDSHATGG